METDAIRRLIATAIATELDEVADEACTQLAALETENMRLRKVNADLDGALSVLADAAKCAEGGLAADDEAAIELRAVLDVVTPLLASAPSDGVVVRKAKLREIEWASCRSFFIDPFGGQVAYECCPECRGIKPIPEDDRDRIYEQCVGQFGFDEGHRDGCWLAALIGEEDGRI